jgi:hypothetical protein
MGAASVPMRTTGSVAIPEAVDGGTVIAAETTPEPSGRQ